MPKRSYGYSPTFNMAKGKSAKRALFSPGNAPFYDTFTGDGILNTRSGWTVEATTAQSGNLNSVFATTSGQLTRSTSTTGVHCYHDTGAGAGESWGVWKGGSVGFASDSTQAHTTVDPTNNNTSIVWCIGNSGNTLTDRYVINGTNTGSLTGTVRLNNDDVVEHFTKDIAGRKYLQGYLNGRQTALATASANGRDILTVLGRAPNGRYGLKGNTNTPAARMFTAGNKATDVMIRAISAGRVRQRGVSWKIFFEYYSPNGATPADVGSVVKAYLKDSTGSSDTPIPGFDGVALSNVVCANGKGYGTIANPNVDNVWYELRWEFTDANGNAAFASYPSGNQIIGDIIFGEGQSESGFLDSGVSTGSVIAAPASGYKMSSTANGPLPIAQNYPMPMTVDNGISLMINTIQGYNGGKPVAHVLSYYGGRSYKERGPNPDPNDQFSTTQWQYTTEALQNFAYNAPKAVYMMGGNSDKSPSSTVYQDMIDTANALDAAAGTALLYLVNPLGNVVAAPDASIEFTRREQWRLTRDFPSRFKLCSWRNDMQHNVSGASCDPDHYARQGSTGYTFWNGTTGSIGSGENARRIALGYCLHTGLTTDDYRGPRPIAFRRVNSTTVAWKYALDSFTSISLINSSYANVHTGGHLFCADNTFGTLIYPDGHAVQTAPGDGTCEIFYTLSTGWPATVYSRGIYGADPINPGGATTGAIALDMQNKASAVVGLSGTLMPPVLMQPTYDIGGTNIDYLSA
jgi:hypothetical protein